MQDGRVDDQGAAGGEAAEVPQTPFCGHLRSKRYFMLDVLPTQADEYLDESGYCWCFRTQQVIGPDGGHAAPGECDAQRACYESGLAEPET